MDYFKVVVENVLPILVTILTPILVLLVRRLVVYLEEKMKFKMSEANQQKLDDLIVGAIGFAEEKALQAAKTDPEKLPDGAKKLDTALEFAAAQAKQMGLDQMASDFLKNLIESKLFKMRNEGAVPKTLKAA